MDETRERVLGRPRGGYLMSGQEALQKQGQTMHDLVNDKRTFLEKLRGINK